MLRKWAWLVVVAIVFGGTFAACGDDQGSTFKTDAGGDDATVVGDGFDPFGNDGAIDLDGQALVVMPQNQTVTVIDGQPPPTLQFTATLGGTMVNASWQIDRGEIGSVDANGLFTPKGTLGGKANITATYQGKQGAAAVTVLLKFEQNGDVPCMNGGAGGCGGVGGEGPGGMVSQQTLQVLQGNPVNDPGLAWLYPYDATVWPRGILAPLLQWKNGAQNDYDAIYIHITENAYEYKGYFNKTATPFIHHPIVQKAWQQATYSNAGEDLTVELVFAKGNVAYGPITEKWKIAKGTLKGIVYYNSYGTNLATNYCCTIGNKQFGGATLGIKPGSTAPVLIAGSNQQCRVCHSVAADGSNLVTQRGESYGGSSAYDLKNNNTQTMMNPTDGRFSWPALFKDGTYLFSNSANGNFAGSSALPSNLYSVPAGTTVASMGLPNGLRAASPSFSPDGKHIAFNYFSQDQKSLASIDFDPMTKTFSNLKNLYTPQQGTAVWPSYLPTSDAVVFELETLYNGRDFAGTRSTCDSTAQCSNVGTQAELWWLDANTKTAARLDKLNGKGYAPTGPNSHTDDSLLNYEPTVNPVISGGYAWVVFTSRRLYGNVATVNPYWSDPRFHDISQTPTTKKLWVAAIDLNAMPGSDPSHPAFYLPAQELLAGNSRGFWVVDPCKMDGTSCETGDECCGGYCQPSDGGLVCSPNKPPCATEFEKCTIDADCCGGKGLTCINGRCANTGPN